MNKITRPLLVRTPSLRDMMWKKVTSLLTTGLTLFVLAPTAFSQEDAGFTAVEKSAEGLQEAILMTASKLVQVYGGDTVGPGTLTFNGIFTDGSWQANFSGDYTGEPLALDFTGTYDDSKNAGAFTVTGTYGSATWDGDGSWRYDIVDPQTIHMFWDSAASIIDGIGRLFKPDKHFTTPKKWAMSQLPDGRWHEVDYGEYRTTYFSIPVGPVKREISDWVHPPGGRRGGIAAVTASLPDDGIQLSGSADFDVGTFTGMVNLTPVPEAKGEEAEIAGLGTDTALPTEAPGFTEELLGAESGDIEFNTTLLFIGPDGQATATLKGPGTNGTKIPLVASGFPKGNVNVSVSVNGATLDPAKNQYKVAGAVSPGKVKGTNFQFQVELLIDVPAGAKIKILVYSGKDKRSITYQVNP